MTISRSSIIQGAVLLLAGVLLGYLMFGSPSSTDDSAASQADVEDINGEEDDVIWVSPMHPWIQQDEPGQCPVCGMDLVAMDRSDVREDIYSLTLSVQARSLAQVQTTTVGRGTPLQEISLPGRIEVDERSITRITSHFPGRVRDLNVDFTGSQIWQGQSMASIYSPQLVSAQRELLEAIEHKERNPRLVESARQRLRQWELTDAQIQEIEERGEPMTELDIVSPVSGVVLERNVSHQEHVDEGTVLYEVANLNSLWVVLEAYEDDVNAISEGDRISFEVRSNPGQTYTGEVSYLDRVVSSESRTVRVRAEVSNADGDLRPDMLVRGTIYSGSGADEQLMVPASAVLWTGPRSIVYMEDPAVEAPHYVSRMVELGQRVGDNYVVADGLAAGDEVVTHGAFRIDSEFQLANRQSMMNRPDPLHIEQAHVDDHPGDHEAIDIFHGELPEGFLGDLNELVSSYLEATGHLVNTDPSAARSVLSSMRETIEEMNVHAVPGEGHAMWMQQHETLLDELGEASRSDDPEELRTSFREISNTMSTIASHFDLDVTLYEQYCPMAFDGDGAAWLSEDEEIQNPYLPEDMLDCGEVLDRID